MKINNVDFHVHFRFNAGCKDEHFDEAFYIRNKNKYSVTVVESNNGFMPKLGVAVQMPKCVIDSLDDGIAFAVYKDVLRHSGFDRVLASRCGPCKREYSGYIVLDIDDAKLSSKCKMLGIDTKIVLRYIITDICGSNGSNHRVVFDAVNFGAVNIDMLDRFNKRIVSLS